MCVRLDGPFKTVDELELALSWVHWYNNNQRLHSALDHVTPTEYEQAYYRQDTLPAGAAAGTSRRALTRGGSRWHAGSGPVRHGLGMASTSEVWDLVRSRYSDSRERLREFRVRVRSAFAISAAAGFMNRIQPKSSPTAMW